MLNIEVNSSVDLVNAGLLRAHSVAVIMLSLLWLFSFIYDKLSKECQELLLPRFQHMYGHCTNKCDVTSIRHRCRFTSTVWSIKYTHQTFTVCLLTTNACISVVFVLRVVIISNFSCCSLAVCGDGRCQGVGSYVILRQMFSAYDWSNNSPALSALPGDSTELIFGNYFNLLQLFSF